jgi:hypothetical protein
MNERRRARFRAFHRLAGLSFREAIATSVSNEDCSTVAVHG